MGPPPPLKRVQHVGIRVHDLDAAVAFYTGVLGMTVSDRYDPGDNPHNPWGICFLRCGSGHHEISLIGFPKEANLQPSRVGLRGAAVGLHHVAFEAASREEFDRWVAHLRALGVEFVMGPVVHSPAHPEGDGTLGENRAVYFLDPSGNGIEIFCDLAEMDPGTNRVSEAWFRDRLRRDGHSPAAADPPPAWRPGVSSMAGARERSAAKKTAS